MALPKVSAVIPVPSETKNTVRWGMVMNIGVGVDAAPYNARNLAHFAKPSRSTTPTTGRRVQNVAARRF
jgi:hypothetical protein